MWYGEADRGMLLLGGRGWGAGWEAAVQAWLAGSSSFGRACMAPPQSPPCLPPHLFSRTPCHPPAPVPHRSHENPLIQALYDKYLGEPNSHKAHELLHTHYEPGYVEEK